MTEKEAENIFKRAQNSLFWLRTRNAPTAFNDKVRETQKICAVYGNQLSDSLHLRMVWSCLCALFIFTGTFGKFLEVGFAHPRSTTYVASACLSIGVCVAASSAMIPWKKRTRLYKQFEKFSDDVCATMTSESQRKALGKAFSGHKFAIRYVTVVIIVWVCYTSMPAIYHERRFSTELYPMPCDIAEDSCFHVMFVFVALAWLFSVVLYAFHEVSHAVFVQYSITVFRALKISFEDLKKTLQNINRLSDEERTIAEVTMHQKLDTLIKLHQFIVRWIKEWTAVNKAVTIVRFAILPFMLVSVMIKMTQVPIEQQGETPAGVAIVFITLYIVAAVSDTLDEASTSVAEGAYNSGWEFVIHDKEYVRKLQYVIFRSLRPTRMPGIIHDVTLHDFVQVCKTSYSVFQAARRVITATTEGAS